jgi:hypothetical protein
LGAKRIVHAFRIGIPDENGEKRHKLTGMALLDDVIESGQGLSLDAVEAFYLSRSMNLKRAMSVETNFRVGDKVRSPVEGVRLSDFGYLSVFYILRERRAPVIFAHQNQPALISLGQLGLQYEHIAGQEGLRTPSIDHQGKPCFDDRYTPLAIPASAHNVRLFKDLAIFAVPELTFDASGVGEAIIHLPTADH